MDLPYRRKSHTINSSREEEEADAQMCAPVWKSGREQNSHTGSGRMWNVQGGRGCVNRGDEGNRRM